MDAGYVTRVSTLLSRLHAPVYRAVAAGTRPAQADVDALTLERNRARAQVNDWGQQVGASGLRIDRRPPPGAESTWAPFLRTIDAVTRTLASAGSRAEPTAPSREAPSVAALRPPAAPAAPARPRARRAAADITVPSGGLGPDLPIDLPNSPEELVERLRAGADQARTTVDAWGTALRLLGGAPGDIVGGGVTGPLRVLDRIQTAITILNPPSVANLTERPWFWPAVIGVVGYVGYSVYKSQQQKPAAKAAAAKRKFETAPTMLAPPPPSTGPR